MRNILALARRILQQFAHDKRTIVMFIVGPVLILWLFSVLLDAGTYHPTLACVDLPEELVKALVDEEAICIEYTTPEIARELLADGKVDAVLTLKDGVLTVLVEGVDTSKTGAVLSTVSSAVQAVSIAQRESIQADLVAQFPNLGNISININPLIEDMEVAYLHGDDSWGAFDFFGPVFIGIFIFIFVFITSGMSLVTERTGGTMERLLVTPIKPYQLVCGFCLGFGVVTIIQATIVLWACVSLIGFPNEGSLALVVLVAFSMALVSLTLGLVVSAVAKTPFQVIQFMLILVIPQVLLSGVFDLANAPLWMQVLNKCFPISYGAEALRDIMLRGATFMETGFTIAILWAFIVVFFVLATVSFRRRKTQ